MKQRFILRRDAIIDGTHTTSYSMQDGRWSDNIESAHLYKHLDTVNRAITAGLIIEPTATFTVQRVDICLAGIHSMHSKTLTIKKP